LHPLDRDSAVPTGVAPTCAPTAVQLEKLIEPAIQSRTAQYTEVTWIRVAPAEPSALGCVEQVLVQFVSKVYHDSMQASALYTPYDIRGQTALVTGKG
jgi:hypothetical protein